MEHTVGNLCPKGEGREITATGAFQCNDQPQRLDDIALTLDAALARRRAYEGNDLPIQMLPQSVALGATSLGAPAVRLGCGRLGSILVGCIAKVTVRLVNTWHTQIHGEQNHMTTCR